MKNQTLSIRDLIERPPLPQTLEAEMDEFSKALETIAAVMLDGARTHPDNDWIERRPEYHAGRAEEHLRLLRAGGQQQDHLSHAATRLLMALTLRELG